MRSDGFSMILSGELEVIAAVPGDGDEEEEYDGEGGNDGGYGGAYMGDIEEEGQYSTLGLSTQTYRCIWRRSTING